MAGDALDGSAVRRALEGVDIAYYLIHAMGSPDGFEQLDRRAALIFAEAAREAGVGRIVYLGGLGEGSQLSPHLSSRQEVGLMLARAGVADDRVSRLDRDRLRQPLLRDRPSAGRSDCP